MPRKRQHIVLGDQEIGTKRTGTAVK